MTESSEKPDKDTELDDEGKRLMERARRAFDAGETLPAPKTWREYLVGVVVWVATHWHTKPGEVGDYCCPVCSSTDWVLGQVVGLASDSRWPQPDSGQDGSFPCVQIECTQCGHLQLLDALKLFEPQEPAANASS
jgi:hypothetical protein